MRIVHYHPRALVGDGGVSRSVRRLSAALARAGAQVAIAYEGHGRPHHDGGVRWDPVPHRRTGPVRIPFGLAHALRGSDLLVLHSAWTAHNLRAGAVARSAGVPYVLAPRGAYDPMILRRRWLAKRLWWWVLERRLVEGARAVQVFFRTQRSHLRALGVHHELIVAPNGVRVPPGPGWDGGSGGYLLYVGRFDPQHKGLDLLLRAIGLLPPQRRPTIRLHGPDWRGGRRRLLRLRHDLGLRPWVRIGPGVYGEAKWRLLRRATGFLYPSRWEGFGNSLAEAAALGVPALATPYPLARYLADRGACLLAEANTEALAAGLLRLGGREASGVGRRASEIITEDFDWDTVARSWLSQARRILDTAPAGRPPTAGRGTPDPTGRPHTEGQT